MQALTKSQKARRAIREFKIIVDALGARGYYRPSGKLGKMLEHCLRHLGPEIYGSMNDPRIVELKGLEYVIDRLPRGIEECERFILTEENPFENTSFEQIIPLRRRRTCYRVSENEMCFVISRGLSEIYDIMAHMTFLNVEARKIHARVKNDSGHTSIEWRELEKAVEKNGKPGKNDLDSAIWNLSIILGRPYQETRDSYNSFEKNRKEHSANNGLISLVYRLGERMEKEERSGDKRMKTYFTPSLMNIIDNQKYGEIWANAIKEKLVALKLEKRPIHVISANLHGVVNTLYGWAAARDAPRDGPCDAPRALPLESLLDDLYGFFLELKDSGVDIFDYAGKHGLYELTDQSGAHVDCQLIDTARLESVELHPKLNLDWSGSATEAPVILVMDYAFGTQAFELMDCLLSPYPKDGADIRFHFKSVSIMGKAGILPGDQGDIMLANAHVIEGASDNYIFENDLVKEDFDADVDVHEGPMITVLGTSLQNRAVLQRLRDDYNAIGLEMEGGRYQQAINAAILKGNIDRDIKVRYAYYASDNPMKTGQTLASGPMGKAGVKPTYMITKAILTKVGEHSPRG
ncbi:MAG: hypothetical protein GY859_03360 [Desulfobacterales bacterium]|nr:hypothetical protein [Desulfobacterales bacterium]